MIPQNESKRKKLKNIRFNFGEIEADAFFRFPCTSATFF